jgi:two-component system, response regulator PdtaR
MMGKVVLCIPDGKLLESLKKRLPERGFAEIIAAEAPADVYLEAMEAHPDAVVMEYCSEQPDLSRVVKKLWDKLAIPIILIAESRDVESVQLWGASVVATILAKPVREEELLAALVLSVAAAQRVEKLKEEVALLKDNIESRKVVEKAKGKLMERDQLSEPEAFRRMQRLAMDRRISMRQLAEAILLTESIGG